MAATGPWERGGGRWGIDGSRQVFAPGRHCLRLVVGDGSRPPVHFPVGLQSILGLPVSSLIGKRRTEVPRTDYDNPAWRAHLEDLEQHRPFRNFETTVIDASGVSRPVMISGTPKFAADDTFEGYIGVGNDLTELRRHEREASTTAANLESILANIEQGVVLFDAQYRIVAYDRRLAEWLEIDRDVRGLPYEEVLRGLAKRGEYGPDDAEADPFDLLLTDVIVPGPMTGKALADEVRRRWPGTRLVFMSGYSENILSTQGRLEPGVLLLNKPF